MEIKVLGPGCSNCKRLLAETEKALKQLAQPATLVKVESIEEIARHGVLRTPALVIDGRVVMSGRVPAAAEIAAMINTAATPEIPTQVADRRGR